MADSDDLIWYFAYGANMSTELFVTRRGMRQRSSEAAHLDGYKLSFTSHGVRAVLEPVFANIEAESGGRVHGVLHRLPRRDLDRLDSDESRHYAHLDVEVEGVSSGHVTAITYYSARPIRGRVPSRRYLELLCQGAREFELPDHYTRDIASHHSLHVPVLSHVTGWLIRVVTPLRRFLIRR